MELAHDRRSNNLSKEDNNSMGLSGFMLNLQLLCIYLKATGAVELSWLVLLLPLVGYFGFITLAAYREVLAEQKSQEEVKELFESINRAKKVSALYPTVKPTVKADDDSKPN